MSGTVFIVADMFTPNDDIMESRRTISRRRALGVGGTVSLAGLIAACAPGTKTTNTAASTRTSAFATSTTSVAAVAATEQKLRELLNAAPGCVTTPEETQGPYYFDVDSIRSNITEDRPGLPLELMIRVQNVEGCVVGSSDNPVANAAVEIWHCDAGGVYSGFEVSSQAANNGGASGAGGAGAGGGVRRHRATRRPAIRLRAIRHPAPRPKVVARAAPAAGRRVMATSPLVVPCPTAAMPRAIRRPRPRTMAPICGVPK